MKEQLISFETAKLAKEKGFDEIVTHLYTVSDKRLVDMPHMNSQSIKGYSAPTQSLLQKWLRDEHHLWVEITLWGDGVGTQCLIKKADPSEKENDGSRVVIMEKMIDLGIYTSLTFNYEQTLEAGLQEALKLLS